MLLGYCSGAQAALSPHQVSSNPITGNYALEPHEFAGLGNGNTLTIDSTANVNLQGYFLAGGVPSGSSANSNVINTSGTAWSTGDNSSYGLVGGFFLGGALDAAEVSADENIINVTGGSISISPTSSGGLAAGVVYIMSADDENLSGSASGNKINISAGEIHTWVNGGFSYVKTGESSATSSASSNEVTVTGGTVSGEDRDYISGGMAYALSGNTSGTSNATAQNNRVVISGGSVQLTNVYGSYAYAACQTGNASASNNTVILGTGKYTNVYGGFIEFAVTKGTVNGNEIYIYGDTDLSTGGVIGGQVAMESPTITGNTLIFGYNNTAWTPSSYTIDKVRNFSTIRFANATWGKTITINTFPNASIDSQITKVDASKLPSVERRPSPQVTVIRC